MTDYNPPKFKSALNHGLLIGLLLLIISVVTMLMGIVDNTLINLLTYTIIILGVVFSIKVFRDTKCNGMISYGSALGYGTLVGLFAAIISALGSFIYLSFIDSSVIEIAMENAEIQMIEQGNTDEEIEMAMPIVKIMISPGGFFVMGVLMFTFFGFVTSLIAAAFLKKEGNPFEEEQA